MLSFACIYLFLPVFSPELWCLLKETRDRAQP